MVEPLVKLGPRLEAVAAHVPLGARLGDIGTDHALLPIYLVRQGAARSAIGTDVRGGPLQAAERNLARHGLTGRIALRLGDGLAPIRKGEADVVTIAGMGGGVMLEILNPEREALAGVQTLILQPQGGAAPLRRALLRRGWRLRAEGLVAERERLYTVMRWERGAATDAATDRIDEPEPWPADRRREFWAEYGTLLPAAGGPLFQRVLREEIARLRRVIARLAPAEEPGAGLPEPQTRILAERLAETRRRLSIWEETEQWLYPSA
ncbi:MAG: class I SAM-dependent methyltransferase [Gracilibacteraceae bacterium]|jgi:tRNA (adenine22-N1)-methyltransferase|nr:class I SAM-dependent methyltransferase [Gracilibacteraceae bacterium]